MEQKLSSLKKRAARYVTPDGRIYPDNNILQEMEGMVRDPKHEVRLEAVQILAQMTAARRVLALLESALQDEHAAIRREAAAAFGKLGPDASISLPALLTVLKDEDAKARLEAIKALGAFGAEAAPGIPALIDCLRSSNAILCRMVSVTLSKIGELAVPALIEALTSSDCYVRKEAAWALGEIGPKAEAAMAHLMDMLAQAEGSAAASASAPAPTPETPPAADNDATCLVPVQPITPRDLRAAERSNKETEMIHRAVTQAISRIKS